MKQFIRFFLILGLMFSISSHAYIEEALDAYGAGDFASAKKMFLKSVSIGNPEAMHSLGVMAYQGQGGEINKSEAYSWFIVSADYGFSDAAKLSRIVKSELLSHEAGTAEKAASEKLGKYGKQALSELLYPQFVKRLKPTHRAERRVRNPRPKKTDNVGPVKPKRFQHLFAYTFVEFDVGIDGKVRAPRILKSEPTDKLNDAVLVSLKASTFEPLSVNGEPRYMPNVRMEVVQGFGMKNILTKFPALEDNVAKIKADADAGDAASQYHYAYALKMTKGFAADRDLYESYMQKAAEQGLALAQYELGKSLLYGIGASKDPEAAVSWIAEAARNENIDAQYLLGTLLWDTRYGLIPKGVERQDTKAMFWLARCVERGHPRARAALASLLLSTKDSAVKNPEKALKLIAKSIKKDKKNAELWYLQAKAQAAMNKASDAKKSLKKAQKLAKSAGWDSSAWAL